MTFVVSFIIVCVCLAIVILKCIVLANVAYEYETKIAFLELKESELTLWQQQASIVITRQRTELDSRALAEKQPAAPIPKDMINDLIALTHPDRHGNSKRSTRVFQELQALKGK